MSRLHATVSIELDEKRLDEYRQELEAKDADDLFPGGPRDWTSMLDLVDLLEQRAITRAEIVDVVEGPPPYRPPARRAWWRRLLGGRP